MAKIDHHEYEQEMKRDFGDDYLSAPVAKDPAKKRIEVHVMPDVKDALVELAKQDKRSLLNYIETLLEKHVKEKKKR